MRKFRVVVVAAGLLAAVAGCSSKGKFVPVTGVVTLDGQPYANALVSFMPVGGEDNPYPGRVSCGVTDDRGRFTLKTDQGVSGAVVGKHRVHIQTLRPNPTGQVDPNHGSPDGTPRAGKPPHTHEPIPPEWSAGQKEFEVPSRGTDKANFDITSVKK